MLNAYDEARSATTIKFKGGETYNPHQSYWALLNAAPQIAAPVQGDLRLALDRANQRCNELYRMVKFLHDHDGECPGDHPSWMAGMDRLLDGQSFDALSELKRLVD